jgi:hypothetical protein
MDDARGIRTMALNRKKSPRLDKSTPRTAGGVFLHEPTGRAFVSGGTVGPEHGAAEVLVLTIPRLFGGNGSTAFRFAECLELSPPPTPPALAPPRAWRKTPRREWPPGFFLKDAR